MEKCKKCNSEDLKIGITHTQSKSTIYPLYCNACGDVSTSYVKKEIAMEYAKQNGGTYVLRSEDTDKERSKTEYENEFLKLFDWLGLKHDLFFRQSERIEIHQKYIKKLIV